MPARRPARGRRTTPVLFLCTIVVLLFGVGYLAWASGREHPVDTTAANFVPALWPEQWRDDLRAAQRRADTGGARWRLHPEETALRFVRSVMQWPSIERLERCDARQSEVCRRPGIHYALSRATRRPPLIVTLDRLARDRDGGVWSVVSVQGPRVFLDITPGETITVGERRVATTTLPSKVDGYLRTGSSYTVPGGCGSGGGHRAKVEDGTIRVRMSLDAVGCGEASAPFGVEAFWTEIDTGEPLRTSAVGFVFVALDQEGDPIGYAMDTSMPPDIRADFVGPEPILELAAVPVYFSPD